MRAFLARLLRSLTSTTLSAQLAGMLIGGILFLHGVATFTVQLVEERQAARSALLEQANSLALSLQLLHSEPFEYKRSLLERLERLDVVHLSLSDAPNPARQARDERALYLRDRLRKNLNSIETDLDTREMLTEVQRVHVADSMNPTLRRHVPWTHVYESRVSVRLDDGKWLCVVISSDAYDFSPSQASLTMLLLEAGLLILLILVVVHRVVRPLRVLSGKAESFGRNLYTAPLPEDGPTEVREAARAFNKMQERIRAGVGQHERILAAVAHDLRTPLTRIRLRVESMDPASPLRAKLLGDIDILGGIMANSAELTRGSARDEAAVRMDMNALLDSLVSDRQDMGQDVSLEGSCARRSGTAAAGVFQPAGQRPALFRQCPHPAPGKRRYPADRRAGRRPGHPPRHAGTGLRALLPPGRGTQPPHRRQRPGPEHRPQHGLPQRRGTEPAQPAGRRPVRPPVPVPVGHGDGNTVASAPQG